MSDLPSTFAKVNDIEVAQDAPISEALNVKYGSDINYLYDNLIATIAGLGNVKLGHQTFSTPGSGSWSAPANLYGGFVICIGCGGGGGGSGADTLGAEGGWGANPVVKIASATAGNSHALIVGAAGAGGSGSNVSGNSGGDTSFTGVLIGQGGRAGRSVSSADSLNLTRFRVRGAGGGVGQTGDDTAHWAGGVGIISGGQSGSNASAAGTNGDPGFLSLVWFEKT